MCISEVLVAENSSTGLHLQIFYSSDPASRAFWVQCLHQQQWEKGTDYRGHAPLKVYD